MRGAAAVLGTVLTMALAGPAAAAGPGDTLLASRPAGLGPLPAGIFAWNASGIVEGFHQEATRNAVSGDGRFVAFVSEADGLLPAGEDPVFPHVFRKDLQTGALTVVDAGGNGTSTDPDISGDGRFVVFASDASNLAPGANTRAPKVLLADLQTGTVTLVATGADTDELTDLDPVISADGSEIAFATHAPLLAGDNNTGKLDVYAMARVSRLLTTISMNAAGTSTGNGDSFGPSITDDGAKVAYLSTATDLDPGNDTTNGVDLYVRALSGAKSALATGQDGNSFGIGGGQVAEGQITGDGTKVVFIAGSKLYDAADTDDNADVFERTLATKDNILVSVAGAANADRSAFNVATDSTGDAVGFQSSATNLGGTVPGPDLYVRHVGAGTTSVITDGADGIDRPAITHGTGAAIVFVAGNALADGPSPSAIHLEPLAGGAPTLVSVTAGGPALTPGLTSTRPPDFTGEDRRVSTDGRFVVFASAAPALGGPAGREECWRRDMRTGETLLVSTGPTGPVADCFRPSISADGGRVAFLTQDALSAPDTGNDLDAYVHDVATGANILASRPDGTAGEMTDGDLSDTEISGDGRHVAFISNTTALGVPGAKYHAYVRDLGANTTTVVSRAVNGDIATAEDDDIGIDAAGDRIAFVSREKLDPGPDDNVTPDVYVRDLAAGTTVLASRQSDADGGAVGNLGSGRPVISDDGRRVAFVTSAQNLVPALAPWPGGAVFQIDVRDLAARTTAMASTSPDGVAPSNGTVFWPTMDAPGDTVGFEARNATVIASSQADGAPAIVVRRLSTGTTDVVHVGPLDPDATFSPGATLPALSRDGRCVAFFARGRDVLPGMSPDFSQLYERVLQGDCGVPSPPAPTGATTTTAGGQGQTQLPAVQAPVISALSLTNRRFRASAKPTALSAKKRRRAPAGTVVRFRLSDPAAVRFGVAQILAGRRSGRRCVKPTAKRRKRARCERAVLRGTLRRAKLPEGANRVSFSGRLGRKRLKPGRYRLTLVATGTTGLVSKPVSVRFTVVR